VLNSGAALSAGVEEALPNELLTSTVVVRVLYFFMPGRTGRRDVKSNDGIAKKFSEIVVN